MENTKLDPVTEHLKQEIIRLGPWHQEVQVTPDLSTRVSQEAVEETENIYAGVKDTRKISFLSARDGFVDMMKKIYPDGLEGRSFLECACNCGAYCFWAKELGASRCFGFDVRDHWINQARFLAANRTWPSDDISFEVLDLLDLPKMGVPRFDVTLFSGIFYHLPDPVTGLKAAADMTDEVLILSTAAASGQPDGMMKLAEEGTENVMMGVYGLNWFPTGPQTLIRILNWMGFPETRVSQWNRSHFRDESRNVDRIRIIASRKEGLLKNIVSVAEPKKIVVGERLLK